MIAAHLEFHLGMGRQAQPVADSVRNRNLSLARDPHCRSPADKHKKKRVSPGSQVAAFAAPAIRSAHKLLGVDRSQRIDCQLLECKANETSVEEPQLSFRSCFPGGPPLKALANVLHGGLSMLSVHQPVDSRQ
jgi:hypothetical protein